MLSSEFSLSRRAAQHIDAKLTVKLVSKKLFTFQILFAAAFFCVFSCAAPKKDPYILSSIPQIQEFEKVDHGLCTSFKLNFDGKENLINRDYWQCRLTFAKYRLAPGRSQISAPGNNGDIQDLISLILVKVTATPESVIKRENQKMDEHDHKKCLNMGFVIDSDDFAKIEDYFACRKVLIEEHQLIPPFGNLDYLDYRNNSYNIGFVIDQRITKEIERYKELEKRYPTCVKYNVNGLNFKHCVEAQEKSRQCYEGIPKKKFRIEGERKVTCQKLAYSRFGDQLMKGEDWRKNEMARDNKNSDYYNKQSLSSIGISQSDFGHDQAANSGQEKKSDEPNPKAGLYEKYELTRLRQKFVVACQNDAASAVETEVEKLKAACEFLEKFEVIGE